MHFQPGVPAFTVKQPEDAMAVLRDRAKDKVSVHSEVSFRHCSGTLSFKWTLLLKPVLQLLSLM